jgi:hypothetical protein
VIGPQIPWDHVATLCDWIKINSPEKPVILLTERRSVRWPANVDAVVPTQPVQLLIERLRSMLSAAGEQNCELKSAAVRHAGVVGVSSRLRNL